VKNFELAFHTCLFFSREPIQPQLPAVRCKSAQLAWMTWGRNRTPPHNSELKDHVKKVILSWQAEKTRLGSKKARPCFKLKTVATFLIAAFRQSHWSFAFFLQAVGKLFDDFIIFAAPLSPENATFSQPRIAGFDGFVCFRYVPRLPFHGERRRRAAIRPRAPNTNNSIRFLKSR